MKITRVSIIQPQVGPPAGGEKVGMPWNPTFVRIDTDEGIHGIGEIGLPMGQGAHGQVGLARDYATLLIGEDPMRTSAIWNRLYRSTFWAIGGGMFIFGVISAIDTALWDIKGKALGVPVYQLLGGKTRDRLRTYASQIQFDWDETFTQLSTAEEHAEAARKAMAQGFDCVKINPLAADRSGRWVGWPMRGSLTHEQLCTAVERVEAVREAVGEAVDIIVELHGHTDANTATQVARALEPYRILYLEEATGALNWKSMRAVQRATTIPLATGERLYTRMGFRPYLEQQVISLAQPDVGNCGGYTEALAIAAMADTYDIGFQCHQIGSPLSTAVALQIEAVVPNFVLHEHNNTALARNNRELCLYDYQPANGKFEVPSLPGIGQDLTDEVYDSAPRFVVD